MINKKLTILFTSILIIANSCYLGLEMFKHTIRNQWMNNETVSKEAFTKLSQLGNWSYFIEFLLIILIISGALWFIFNKQGKSLTHFIILNISVCILFITIGISLAALFKAPQGNLVQQLYGPGIILVILIIYQGLIKLSVTQKKLNRSE